MPILLIAALIVVIAICILRGIIKKRTIVIPDCPLPPSPPPEPDDAIQVYHYEESRHVWCCPNCQCENNYSSTQCCVCNYQR